jgi:hypothetical protein
MNNPFHPPRHAATHTDNSINEIELDRFTYSVADAVLAFREASMSITERTVQRYCQSGKLRAVQVDPDTRGLTDKDNYLFLIDPASIPERVAQLREKQEFIKPTVVAASHDMSRQDAARRDESQAVASDNKDVENEGNTAETDAEHETLRQKAMSLEIDKRVRDGLIDQLKNDRGELMSQLQHHVETITTQSRMIGQLETRLELSVPEPIRKLRVYESTNQDAMPEKGDNPSEYIRPNDVQ